MKSLLASGAAALAIAVSSAYAGGSYQHDYDDCCQDELVIELVGEVECVCEITFLSTLAFQQLALVNNTLHVADGLLSAECNTGEDLEITFESANGGFLERVGGGASVPYQVQLAAAPVVFGADIPYNGAAATVGVLVQGDGLLAGTYTDTVTITVMPVF